MIISEEAYLEHYGVKGMKWGVYKKKFLKSQAKAARANAKIFNTRAQNNPNAITRYDAKKAQSNADRRTRRAQGKETKAEHRRRVITNTFRVGLGVAAVAFILSSNGNTSTSRIPRSPASQVEQTIRQAHAVKLSSLTRMHAEGKMDKEQFKNFSKALSERYDRKIVDALKALKDVK